MISILIFILSFHVLLHIHNFAGTKFALFRIRSGKIQYLQKYDYIFTRRISSQNNIVLKFLMGCLLHKTFFIIGDDTVISLLVHTAGKS